MDSTNTEGRRSRRFLPFLALALAAAAFLPATPADAAPHGAAVGSPLSVHMSPVLGHGNLPNHFAELRVEVRNNGAHDVHGTLKLLLDPWTVAPHVLLEIPLEAPAGDTVSLQVPLMLRENAHSVKALVLDSSGHVETEAELGGGAVDANFVLADIHERSPFAASFGQGHGREFPSSTTLLRATRDTTDARGDGWILPQSYVGYTNVSTVLLDTSTFLKLSAPHLRALTGWVERGGTVAFVVSRPGDLSDSAMKKLIGEHVTETPVTPATVARVLSLSPVRNVRPNFHASGQAQLAVPSVSPFSQDHLRTDFAGGAARPCPYGAQVDHGMGTIVLLSFDPNEPGVADEAFTRSKMFGLLSDSQRRSQDAFANLSHVENAGYNSRSLRKTLDPNEGFRIGLGFGAGLLCIYAILVGPLLFFRAKKRGTPLAPYVVAPVLSGATFVAILATGSVSRGLTGGVRRIAVVEQASGEYRGTTVTYRGFYPSSSTTMRIEAPPHAEVDLALSDPDAIAGERLELPGVSLGTGDATPRQLAYGDIRTRPWRTFIARQFESYESKGSVLLNYTGSDVIVANETAEAIHTAFVSIPHEGVYYIDKTIRPGESVSARKGTRVFHTSTAETIEPLRDYQLEQALPAAQRDHFRKTWGAIGELRSGTNFWPADRPVLLGEIEHTLDGVSTPQTDSGLSVRSTQILLRVVGRETSEGRPRPARIPRPPELFDGKDELE